jgi:hypothetical protein
MERGKLDIMYDKASNILDRLNRSVAKGDTNKRLNNKMKAVEKSKTNLMAAGLNKLVSNAQRTRVAEMSVWMEEAKNEAKGVKKARYDKIKSKSGLKRDPSTNALSFNRGTIKQSRLGDASPQKQASI